MQLFENIEDNEILENIYNYIVINKNKYTFKMNGIHYFITADILLKVIEVVINGDIKIILNDGVYLYSEIFKNSEYVKKFHSLVQSGHKIEKYKKDDKRHFYKIANSLKTKKEK